MDKNSTLVKVDQKTSHAVEPALIALEQYYPVLIGALSNFFITHPMWQMVFLTCFGLYGIVMNFRRKRVLEIVKFIEDNPKEFRKEIIESEEFQGGFFEFLERYLKERIERKKDILKLIFLGFTIFEEKEKFELERLNDCLSRISIDGLEFIKFLNEVSIPKIEKNIDEALKQETYHKSDRSLEWWKEKLWEAESIWAPIEKWIYENYNPNSQKVKDQYGLKNEGWIPDVQTRVFNLERSKKSDIINNLDELNNLGIIKSRTTGTTFGGSSGTDYVFTKFGRNFIKYVLGKTI